MDQTVTNEDLGEVVIRNATEVFTCLTSWCQQLQDKLPAWFQLVLVAILTYLVLQCLLRVFGCLKGRVRILRFPLAIVILTGVVTVWSQIWLELPEETTTAEKLWSVSGGVVLALIMVLINLLQSKGVKKDIKKFRRVTKILNKTTEIDDPEAIKKALVKAQEVAC